MQASNPDLSFPKGGSAQTYNFGSRPPRGVRSRLRAQTGTSIAPRPASCAQITSVIFIF